jgi:TetR/AcrR family transcriptional regulator, repressor for neighboring sulfatase
VARGTRTTSSGADPGTAKTTRKKADGVSGQGTARRGAGASSAAGRTKPYGREQVIESIIDATLSLWTAKGPEEVSLRSIAAKADVTYGLVYRHFRTKEAVIRAAMNRVVSRSLEAVEPSTDLVDAMDRVLPRSTGAHARLLAWAILQYLVDDILPPEDAFLQRLVEIASAGAPGVAADADPAAKVRAGSWIAMLYGWRLFEPYLVHGLKLDDVPREELDALIRDRMIKAIAV